MNANFPGIYEIFNTVDGKRYIGSSVNVSKRIAKHQIMLISGVHHSQRLQNAYDKYGPLVFEFNLLESVPLKSKLLDHEQVWLDIYQSYGSHGYNVAPRAGSSLGRKMTRDTKAKIAAAHTGMKRSAETRANISLSRKGSSICENGRLNMSAAAKRRGAHSKEVYAKIAESLRGQKRSDQARANISASKLGSKFSESHKEALRKAWELRKLQHAGPRYSRQ